MNESDIIKINDFLLLERELNESKRKARKNFGEFKEKVESNHLGQIAQDKIEIYGEKTKSSMEELFEKVDNIVTSIEILSKAVDSQEARLKRIEEYFNIAMKNK
jgi:hypothetical protein